MRNGPTLCRRVGLGFKRKCITAGERSSQNTVPVFCSDVNELVPSVCVSPKQTKRRAKVRDRYLGQRFLFQCSLGLRTALRNTKWAQVN